MPDTDDVQQLRQAWAAAEAAYARSLSTAMDEQPRTELTRSTAIELAGLRASADRARDRYLKRVLR